MQGAALIHLPVGAQGHVRIGGVVVEVRQRGLGRRTELSAQSIEGELKDAQTIVWRVPVPANGETKLTATVTTGG